MATTPRRPSTPRQVSPAQPPELPVAYPEVIGTAHLIESMMQIQQSVGELKANVSHLTTSSEKQSGKLDKLSHRIYAATVVITILLAIGGFILNKVWDGVVTLMITQARPAASAAPTPAPPPTQAPKQ